MAPAFAAGCGGDAREGGPWRPGPSAIYGVKAETKPVWDAMRRGVDRWFYIDNAYFGPGLFFRITEGALQHAGTGPGDAGRLARLDIDIRPWRTGGRHIVVCTQSDNFMARTCDLDPSAWRADVTRRLAAATDRPVVWRSKQTARPFAADLDDAWAVVTHTSNCAIEAVCAGVPAVVTGPSAASPMAAGPIEDIERPRRPDGRLQWAGVLAANQWTLDEMRDGAAWAALNDG